MMVLRPPSSGQTLTSPRPSPLHPMERRGRNAPRLLENTSDWFDRTIIQQPKDCQTGSLSLGRVALLGIAQRQVRLQYPANLGNQKRAKVLKLNVKTAGDWLKVKRLEKNLTPGHVAAKMGIATSLVGAWENSTQQPENQQLKVLASVLDFDTNGFETVVIKPKNMP